MIMRAINSTNHILKIQIMWQCTFYNDTRIDSITITSFLVHAQQHGNHLVCPNCLKETMEVTEMKAYKS